MHLFWEEEGWQKTLYSSFYRAWELHKKHKFQDKFHQFLVGSIFFKGSTSNSDMQPGLEATGGLWEYLILKKW